MHTMGTSDSGKKSIIQARTYQMDTPQVLTGVLQSPHVVSHHNVSSVVLTEIPVLQRVEYEAVIIYHTCVVIALIVWVQCVS